MDHALSIPASAAKRTFHTLDGLRGLAAVSVVLYHLIRYTGAFRFPSAYLAVDLFFLMSGVVIAHVYHEKLRTGLTVNQFMFVRLVRLYPMYLLGLLFAIAMSLLFRARHPSAWEWTDALFVRTILLNLLMLPSPVEMSGATELFPLNLVSWSLFWELVINLLYGACASRLTDRRLYLLAVASGAALVWTAISLGNLDGGYDLRTLYAGPIRVTFSFVVGLIVYRLHKAGQRFPFAVSAPLLLLVAVLTFMLDVAGTSRIVLDLAAVMLAYPSIVFAALENEPVKGKAFYTFLGVISYPLYMLHVQVLAVAESIASLAKISMAHYAPYTGLVILSAAVVVSWLAVVFYDVPARQMAGRLLRVR